MAPLRMAAWAPQTEPGRAWYSVHLWTLLRTASKSGRPLKQCPSYFYKFNLRFTTYLIQDLLITINKKFGILLVLIFNWLKLFLKL
jgi:hypothetical protein